MRLRLLLAFLFIVIITTLSMVFFASFGAKRELNAFISRGGMFGVEEIVKRLENHYMQNGSWKDVEAIMLVASIRPVGREDFQYRGPGGQGGGPSLGSRSQLLLANSSGDIIYPRTEAAFEPRTLTDVEIASSIEIKANRSLVGYLYPEGETRITSDTQAALLNRMNQAAMSAALLAGLISLGLSSLFGYLLLRPVVQLTHAASQMAKGDLSQRVDIKGKDELAILGRTFNHMASSLELAETNRKAMTADIAHELRTPLAVQRANLEAIQDGIYEMIPENLTPLLQQNLQLERLVEDLRTLALAESGHLEIEPITAEITPFLMRIVDNFIPQASSNGVQLIFQPGDEVLSAMYDPRRLEQVLNNLISNALRFTPEDGRIEIRISKTDSAVKIEVQDSGKGIPEDILPYIFNRFYRGDHSRSRSEGGTGLGLSIARQLTEAQGGTISAENHPAGGGLFTILLPAV